MLRVAINHNLRSRLLYARSSSNTLPTKKEPKLEVRRHILALNNEVFLLRNNLVDLKLKTITEAFLNRSLLAGGLFISSVFLEPELIDSCATTAAGFLILNAIYAGFRIKPLEIERIKIKSDNIKFQNDFDRVLYE